MLRKNERNEKHYAREEQLLFLPRNTASRDLPRPVGEDNEVREPRERAIADLEKLRQGGLTNIKNGLDL
jgi:hypothetical protein